jgi:predicted Na+-dependent transporter
VEALLDVNVSRVNILMMAAVGMGPEGRHLRVAVRRRGILVLALAARALGLPLVGRPLTRLMGLPPRISAGTLLLAVCPVGNKAKFSQRQVTR